MSNWKEHLKFGITLQLIMLIPVLAIYIYLKIYPNWFQLILLLPIFFLSPLFPDIDHQSSKITSLFYLLGIGSLWIGYYFYNNILIYSIIFLSFVVSISQFIKHRTITHKLWFIILLHILLGWFSKEYTLLVFSFIGMFSHLIKDNLW